MTLYMCFGIMSTTLFQGEAHELFTRLSDDSHLFLARRR